MIAPMPSGDAPAHARTPRHDPARWTLAILVVTATAALPIGAVTWVGSHSALPGPVLGTLFGAATLVALFAALRWVMPGILKTHASVVEMQLPPRATATPTAAPLPRPPSPAPRPHHDDPGFMTRLYESMAARAAAEGRGTPSPAQLRLVDAVLSGDEDNLRIALREGAGLDGPPFPDATAAMMGPALCHAVNAGRHAIVKLLLDAGASPNVEAALRSDDFDQEISALHLACSRGDAALVSMLLSAGADPNGILKRWTVDGESHAPCLAAVLVSAMEGETRAGLARLLLDAGADPNRPGRWCKQGEWHDVSPLSLAQQDPRMTQLLQERGATP